jgi:deazaflavin-dependent oxidoreductase (nitroreductase family)
MGLQADLTFTWRRPNVVQRGVAQVASTSGGSWLLHKVLYRIDRPLNRWSRGRVTLPPVLTGMQVLMLTTTGARTGLPRTMPIAAIPFGEDFVAMGTNFAQPRSPAWAINLAASPRARADWRGTVIDVTATRVPVEQMDQAWAAAERVYAGFAAYRQRIGTSREVLAFVLTRATDA